MKNKVPLQEFRPAIRFLLIFVSVYLVGNILYGSYVELYRPSPDPATVAVTRQSAFVLTKFATPVDSIISPGEPIVLLMKESKTVLRVFEGCNGLNVMIVFASFIIAFGGGTKKILIYLLIGVLVIHVSNVLRIILLYQTAIHRPLFFYYFHKYFFTAVLYLVVFGLWFEWMRMNSKASDPAKA